MPPAIADAHASTRSCREVSSIESKRRAFQRRLGSLHETHALARKSAATPFASEPFRDTHGEELTDVEGSFLAFARKAALPSSLAPPQNPSPSTRSAYSPRIHLSCRQDVEGKAGTSDRSYEPDEDARTPSAERAFPQGTFATLVPLASRGKGPLLAPPSRTPCISSPLPAAASINVQAAPTSSHSSGSTTSSSSCGSPLPPLTPASRAGNGDSLTARLVEIDGATCSRGRVSLDLLPSDYDTASEYSASASSSRRYSADMLDSGARAARHGKNRRADGALGGRALSPFDLVDSPSLACSRWSQNDWLLLIRAAQAGVRTDCGNDLLDYEKLSVLRLLERLLTPGAQSAADMSAPAGTDLPRQSSSGSGESDGGSDGTIEPQLAAASAATPTSTSGRHKQSSLALFGQAMGSGHLTPPTTFSMDPQAFSTPGVPNASSLADGPSACPFLASLANTAVTCKTDCGVKLLAPHGQRGCQGVRGMADLADGGPLDPHPVSPLGMKREGPRSREGGRDSMAAAAAVGRQVPHEQLVEAVVQAHDILAVDDSPNGSRVCGFLLRSLLTLTRSTMGFIASLHFRADGSPFLKTHAITNVGWTPELRQWHTESEDQGLVFGNMGTLFGAVVMTSDVIISNDPARDPRSSGVPPGHPKISSFLGVPLLAGGELVGLYAVANAEGGYNSTVVVELEPLTRTAAQILSEVAAKQQRTEGGREEAPSISPSPVVTVAARAVFDQRGALVWMNQAAESSLGQWRAGALFGDMFSLHSEHSGSSDLAPTAALRNLADSGQSMYATARCCDGRQSLLRMTASRELRETPSLCHLSTDSVPAFEVIFTDSAAAGCLTTESSAEGDCGSLEEEEIRCRIVAEEDGLVTIVV